MTPALVFACCCVVVAVLAWGAAVACWIEDGGRRGRGRG